MITADEAKRIAALLREDGLPDSLNRWLATLPAEIKDTLPMPKAKAKTEIEALPVEALPVLEPLPPGELHRIITAEVEPDVLPPPPVTPEPIPQPNRKAAGASKKAAAPKTPPKAKAAPKAAARGKEARPGSKLEIIVKLLRRKGGCTMKQALAATGWPAISMPQQARAAGLKLKKEKRDGIYHYSA
jgi:hypothetical protein